MTDICLSPISFLDPFTLFVDPLSSTKSYRRREDARTHTTKKKEKTKNKEEKKLKRQVTRESRSTLARASTARRSGNTL